MNDKENLEKERQKIYKKFGSKIRKIISNPEKYGDSSVDDALGDLAIDFADEVRPIREQQAKDYKAND